MKTKIMIALLAIFLIGCGSSRRAPEGAEGQSNDKSNVEENQQRDDRSSRDGDW